MRLVLCDDNRILGEALAAALTAHGHEVATVTTSVPAGIAAVSEHLPDACLLDLRFPGEQDGITAVRAIRGECPGTAVVILSGMPDPAAVREARQLAVAGILRKDQSVDRIAQALDTVASGAAVYDVGCRFASEPWCRSEFTRCTNSRRVSEKCCAGSSRARTLGRWPMR